MTSETRIECPFKIGDTPLKKLLIRVGGIEHELSIKEERLNEFGSVKDRVAWYVLSRSMPSEDWKGSVVDASSGNYGYALSRIGERLGLGVTIVSSPSISSFNADGIRNAGANLVIAEAQPGESSNGARMRVAGEISQKEGSLFLDQYNNSLNPESHERWTAPEVFAQAEFDACFVAASSGGTARGFADYLSKHDLKTELHLVEPFSACTFETPADTQGSKLFIPGYGSGRKSTFADGSDVETPIRISESDVIAAQLILTEKGLADIGLSSIGVMMGAVNWLMTQDKPQRVVCICADGSERYAHEIQSRYVPKVDASALAKSRAKISERLAQLRPAEIVTPETA
ncbi:pyridoxal-phosphate dependent enzyme [Ponticaulis sp.]|uniref:pyridoxal-phosphate dependent enzyme n=1 Tax=Ponticaulis sp. TaxID=2020902 RepID=UPI000B6D5641|nr:pyridoxal-phosphate dependent enzyme [Ponticaulis sp.]MAI90904.1 hypothetical protein [Ponticaulis sp.]OUX98248.1 MAG: hypothetical protein CBB65_10705 [Hyphomonadaceae bacterium TMED5]|tara:strand:- start:6103 stop:7134 length:1032 start_codon:yes stop_codon:yes gene_type:complete